MKDHVLFGKVVIGLTALLFSVVTFKGADRLAISKRSFFVRTLSLLLLTRLVLFAGVLCFANDSSLSDVTVYYDEGLSVLDGKIPLLHFSTPYGPLFPYFAALPLLLWNTPKAIVLFSILVELASFPLWIAIGRRVFDEVTTRRAAMLYLFNPLPLIAVPLAGQNQVWVSFFLALAFFLALKRRYLFSGMVLGFSVLAVKFFSLVFVPLFLLSADKKWITWFLGFLTFPLLIYGVLAHWGVPVADVFLVHGAEVSSGNFFFLLSALRFNFNLEWVRWTTNLIGIGILSGFLMAAWWTGRLKEKGQLVIALGGVVLAVLFVSKKAFTGYLLQAYFPLCIAVALVAFNFSSVGGRLRGVLSFGLFGLLAAVEPSLWFRWMKLRDFRLLHSSTQYAQRWHLAVLPWHVWTMLIADIFLVGAYGYALLCLWKLLEPKRFALS